MKRKSTMEKRYSLVEHTADLEIVAYGDDLRHLFVNALHGMFTAAKPRLDPCHLVGDQTICYDDPIVRKIDVFGADRQILLVDYLSEALYLSDVHDEAYLDATVEMLTDTRIIAGLHGYTVVGFSVEIKAVTYHGLSIEKQEDGSYQAHVVFDI